MNAGNCTGETEIRTWIRFLATHSAITRELEARLMGTHGLTLSDYDVLVQLARAPERKLRNIDVAKAVVLTRSGVTRLVDGLEKDGLVRRSSCDSDKRGTFVEITDDGLARLREAALTQVDGVRELFVERLGKDGVEQMDALLRALPAGSECLESRACLADPDALEASTTA
jgi:DNA-binding MarR family transcriptional regulator